MDKKLKISFNAPTTLTFSLICLVSLILGFFTQDVSTNYIFSVYRSSFADPLTYVRLIGHVFGHADWFHFIGNMTLILILGPMLEEKYGTGSVAFVILVTAVGTGIINMLFFPHVALLGASGVVFAFIILSSITSIENKTIPLTFILVSLIYIGQEVYSVFFVEDNVANLTHILGGVIGAICGYVLNRRKFNG